MKKKILVIGLIFSALLVMTSCGQKKIKLENFIEITYSLNYDGLAEPRLEFDEEKFNQQVDYEDRQAYAIKIMKKMPDYKENKEFYEQTIEYMKEYEVAPELTDWFDIDFAEDYSKLRNGDKVVVEVKANNTFEQANISVKKLAKGLGIKFKKTKIEFEVEDLKELSKKVVDFDKLISIDFGRINKYATPTLTFNHEYLNEITIDEVVEHYLKGLPNIRWSLDSDDFDDWFEVSFAEEYNNISNGDEIRVLVKPKADLRKEGITLSNIEEGIMLEFGNGSKTYTVSGLEDATGVIDVFEGISQYINFDGANGYGSVSYSSIEIPKDFSRVVGDVYLSYSSSRSIKAVYNNKNIGTIYFDCDDDNLRSGDHVELEASISNDLFEENGFVVPNKTKIITVPDLGVHLTSIEQLTPERVEALKNYINEVSSPTEICEIYYGKYNPGYECSHKVTSVIGVIVYKKGFLSSGYYIDTIYDVILRPDGTVTSLSNDYSKASSWSDYSTLDKARENLNTEKFALELIK